MKDEICSYCVVLINYDYIIKLCYTTNLYRVIRNDCRGFNYLSPRSPDAYPRDFFL